MGTGSSGGIAVDEYADDETRDGYEAVEWLAAQPWCDGQVGMWGISYGANLTPDPETGLKKRYTEASFIRTLRTGKKPEGEDLLPPMPWALYKTMTDEDLKALYAYLQTIPAVKNNVKNAVPPGKTRNGYLRELCYKGLHDRYGERQAWFLRSV